MKVISDLLNIVRTGAGVVPGAEGLTADDVPPLARAAAAEANVALTARRALHWRTHDLVMLAKAGGGRVIYQ
jgi:hypothetical protein